MCNDCLSPTGLIEIVLPCYLRIINAYCVLWYGNISVANHKWTSKYTNVAALIKVGTLLNKNKCEDKNNFPFLFKLRNVLYRGRSFT